jgi:PTH1 family peptidyl-tRNA hydrolase
MNTSGGPVSKLARAHHVQPTEILVVHDEVDLDAGLVRVKFGGGLNAHNGLRSIADKLKTRDFARVRVGISRPPGRMDVATYVLRQLKGTLADELRLDAEHAADAVGACLERGVTWAEANFR